MADPNTSMGGSGRTFPDTRWSILASMGEDESPRSLAAVDALARVYWRPVYAYIRVRWRKTNEEAKDLTQEFFAGILERNALSTVSNEGGRFRSYVMASLDNLARLQHRRESRQKRGGDKIKHSWESLEGFEPSIKNTPEQTFQQEWVRSLLEDALQDLQREYREKGWETRWEIFHGYDVARSLPEDSNYESTAARFGVSVSEVKNALYVARLHLRKKVIERVRETVTSERDLESEMGVLFGESGP